MWMNLWQAAALAQTRANDEDGLSFLSPQELKDRAAEEPNGSNPTDSSGADVGSAALVGFEPTPSWTVLAEQSVVAGGGPMAAPLPSGLASWNAPAGAFSRVFYAVFHAVFMRFSCVSSCA